MPRDVVARMRAVIADRPSWIMRGHGMSRYLPGDAARADAAALVDALVDAYRAAGVPDEVIDACIDPVDVLAAVVDRDLLADGVDLALRSATATRRERERAESAARRPGPAVQAWECAPVGLDGHRWPCPRAESADAACIDQGCGR